MQGPRGDQRAGELFQKSGFQKCVLGLLTCLLFSSKMFLFWENQLHSTAFNLHYEVKCTD